ncbi:MAG: zf-TFIIB domain-containing protein [Pirellulaceae bacterium]|nr:zf-TFIIB domain-containing protein [Pirellulaceae bacterium]
MKCPVDGSELAKETYEASTEIEKCLTCGGVWLDEKELERIQDSTERDYTDEVKEFPNLVDRAYAMALAQSKPPVTCSVCNSVMERREHGGCSQILIDVCPQCRGVWLDHGELTALEVFFERAGLESEEIRTGFFASLKQLFD